MMMPGTIPPDLRQFVEQELASGKYGNAEEMVTEGLRLLRERKLYELRRDIDAGIEQIERGEGIEIDGEEALRRFFDEVKTLDKLDPTSDRIFAV